MIIKRLFFLVLFWTINILQICAQGACVGLPDYTDLSGPCTRCTYGMLENPLMMTGIVPSRHAVLTQAGFDPNTGNQLPLIPEGYNRSVRLGNQEAGAQSEAITYTFTVDPLNALITLRFAVVFEDPAHTMPNQPRFVVRILDESDQLVEACAEYDVISSEGVPGFRTYFGRGIPVRWRPWTTLGLNLSNYAGRTVKISFTTYDCFHYGHFGYAYFVMEQNATTLSLDACEGDKVTLTAPAGYASYLWNSGETTAQSSLIVDKPPVHTSCLITSETGCHFTLNAIIGTDGADWSSDTTIFDTICQGQDYKRNGFDLPEQWDAGSWVHTATYMDMTQCRGLVRKLLKLTVVQSYYDILADICAGESYHEHGFRFMRPSPGLYTDTIRYQSVNGCDSISCLTLRVSPSFDLPIGLEGSPTPCQLKQQTYSLANTFGMGTYHWEVPKGVYIIKGQGSPTIDVKLTDIVAPRDTIRLHLSNGCGEGSLIQIIEPMPAYYLTFNDSGCTGSTYEGYDFKVAPQDSFGNYTIVNSLKTTCGCDSVRTLYLALFPTPKARIDTDKELICEPEPVSLSLFIEGAKPAKRKVRVGDVLCSDGSLLPLEDYQASDKTAQGVVFFVDRSGYHGWAASLHTIEGKPMTIASAMTDIPELESVGDTDRRVRLKDTCGYQNTLHWRNAGSPEEYPMPWAVDYENGWYIPAFGQMMTFLMQLPFLNATIETLGGTPHPDHLHHVVPHDGWSFGTSTERNDKNYWLVTTGTSGQYHPKSILTVIRPVKSF